MQELTIIIDAIVVFPIGLPAGGGVVGADVEEGSVRAVYNMVNHKSEHCIVNTTVIKRDL